MVKARSTEYYVVKEGIKPGVYESLEAAGIERFGSRKEADACLRRPVVADSTALVKDDVDDEDDFIVSPRTESDQDEDWKGEEDDEGDGDDEEDLEEEQEDDDEDEKDESDSGDDGENDDKEDEEVTKSLTQRLKEKLSVGSTRAKPTAAKKPMETTELVAFCSGSAKNNVAYGCACVFASVPPEQATCTDRRLQTPGEEPCTSNRAQYHAALLAVVQANLIDQKATRPLHVCTNSKLLVNVMSGNNKANKNVDLIELIKNEAGGREVQWEHFQGTNSDDQLDTDCFQHAVDAAKHACNQAVQG